MKVFMRNSIPITVGTLTYWVGLVGGVLFVGKKGQICSFYEGWDTWIFEIVLPPTMPIKCAFCRRKYARAGPYEKYLRTAHANLDIVLASTVRYTNRDAETDLLHHEGQEP